MNHRTKTWRSRGCTQLFLGVVLALFSRGPELTAGRIIGFPLPPPPILRTFVRGDVNRDGKVNVADATHLSLALAASRGGLDVPCLDAADVNDDGLILFADNPFGGQSDVQALVNWLSSLDVRRAVPGLPPPFPGADFDRTNDNLNCLGGLSVPPDPISGYRIAWRSDDAFVAGQQAEIFMEATTREAIFGFSLAYKINSDIVSEFGVEAVVSQGRGGGAGNVPPPPVGRPNLDVSQKESDEPGFDLLIVSVIYVGDDLQVTDFPATQRAVTDFPLLKLTLVLENSFETGVHTFLKPNTTSYPGIGEVGGATTIFVPAGDDGPISVDPPIGDLFNTGASGVIDFLRGDANLDGQVDIVDAVFTVWGLFGGFNDVGNTTGADANDDGVVTADVDAPYTLNYLFGNGDAIPSPFPSCSTTDPTPDQDLYVKAPCSTAAQPSGPQNTLSVLPQTLCPGESNASIPIRLENASDVYGFSLSLRATGGPVKLKEIDLSGTVSNEADYSAGEVRAAGERLTWGVILDNFGPFNKLIPAGQSKVIAKVLVDVPADAPGGTTPLKFEDFPVNTGTGRAGGSNRLVGEGGVTLSMTTSNADLTIASVPANVGPFRRGDCNQDGQNAGTPTDAVFLLGFLFLGTDKPECRAACDFDGDGSLAGTADAFYYLNFNFQGGPPMVNPVSSCAQSTRLHDRKVGCDSFSACP